MRNDREEITPEVQGSRLALVVHASVENIPARWFKLLRTGMSALRAGTCRSGERRCSGPGRVAPGRTKKSKRIKVDQSRREQDFGPSTDIGIRKCPDEFK